MSFQNSYIDCNSIQDLLAGHFGQLSGAFREASPLTEFLTSPVNTQGVLQKQIDAGNGHRRIVELIYSNRLTEAAISSSAELNCDGGNNQGETSKTYELDPTVGSSIAWSIDPSDLDMRCEADELFFARQIQMNIDALVRKINSDNWTKAVTMFGKFVTTGTNTDINIATKNNTTGAYLPDALGKIAFEYKRMNYGGTIAAFYGSYLAEEYFGSQGAFCCNGTMGINLQDLFGMKPLVGFFDYKAETHVGTNKMLTLAPGALQFLTYNKYVGPSGIRSINTETIKYGVIVDPLTGIAFDYYAQIDCGVWKFQLSLAHDLVGLPTDLFALDDYMSGVTWVNRFEIVNS